MAGENIYSFLLAQGAPPEIIQRIMAQLKGGTPLFESRAPGFRGNQAVPFSAQPRGMYAGPTPPRIS